VRGLQMRSRVGRGFAASVAILAAVTVAGMQTDRASGARTSSGDRVQDVSRDEAPAASPWLDPAKPTATRVEALLGQMTLEEKVHLMYGVARPRGVHSVGYVAGVPRLDIPPLVLSDGPVGVKDSCFGELYPDNCLLSESTAFPATVSLAASFDPDLAHQYGSTIGAESRARGVDVLYGPGVNIVRIPQGGRNFEYFSEDPYLTGELATAWIRGLQSQDVAAQAKHYALNNQERDRHTTSSDADERTKREIYLPAFQQAVTEGKAMSLMCSNNMVDGTYMCENKQMQRQVLAEWGFDGVIGSDYAATNSALGSVNGGLDQSFTGRDWGKWYDELPDLVRSGALSEDVIDEHVRRILTMMMKLKMFDADRSRGAVDVAADGAVARDVAERGAVLLKNDGATLPLDAGSLTSVAVLGQYADKAMTGGGGSSQVLPYYSVSPVQGLRNRLGSDVAVTTADGTDLATASATAAAADVAVVVVNDVEKEGADRASIDLPGKQNALVHAVRAANPRTVVVLNTGSPVTMPWLDQVPAVLEMWYPGEEDGSALAALLTGDVNPQGRLPVSFPVNLDQDCCHAAPRYPADENGHYRYTEGLLVGYRWYDAQQIQPLFPFGFGLSYTTFKVDQLRVTPGQLHAGTPVQVHVRVTNTGDRAGTATPQVYLRMPSSLDEPPHRLVATTKVPLAAGESRTVTMTLPRSAYSYWDTDAHAWEVADGRYTVDVGSSSRNLPLSGSFQVAGGGVQGIAVTSPGTVPAGGTTTVTVHVSNAVGGELHGLLVDLTVPAGWSRTTTSAPVSTVAPGGGADVSFRVTAPSSAGAGTYVLTARASWDGGTLGRTLVRAVTVDAS
jgi:beta-glucosidase